MLAGISLHGRNLFPDLPGFREATLAYLSTLTALSQRLIALLARGLGLADDFFLRTLTRDPTVLFRLFNYPATDAGTRDGLGVGEHTDYGLLTLLWQDDAGGLQVNTARSGWTFPIYPVRSW